MKRKLIAILLTLCLFASVFAGFTVNAADYDGQVDVAKLVEYGKQMYAAHEGNYDTVVQNDSGAVGMGILGWRGPNALKLLKMVCSAAPQLSKDTLGEALYTEIVNAGTYAWNYRTFSATEAANTRKLLGTEYGIAAENELARQDITRQIGEAWKQGIRSDAALLYYCSISNHYGPGGAQTFMKYIRKTLGITTSDTINSLDVFHGAVVQAAKTYSYVNNTLAYRTKIYNYIKNVLKLDTTGQTPVVTPPPVCENCPSAGFTDVPAKGSWAHDGIDFVLSRGLFQGTSATTFSPNAQMTRAMLVTVLYRLEGQPAVAEEYPFVDLKDGSYYVGPVCWAAGEGIVNGTDETHFNPDAPVTREQLATILYRYSARKSSAQASDPFLLDGYGDGQKVSGFARTSMAWAVQVGLIRGDASNGDLLLNPQSAATRAQVATILMRYVNG